MVEISIDMHTGAKMYVCKVCNASSNRKYNTEMHIARVHGPSWNVKCQICDKSFKNVVTLENHLKKKVCLQNLTFKEPTPLNL